MDFPAGPVFTSGIIDKSMRCNIIPLERVCRKPVFLKHWLRLVCQIPQEGM